MFREVWRDRGTTRAEEAKDGLCDLVFNKGFPKEVSIIKRCVLEVEGGKRVHGLEYILGAAIALDL